MPLHCHNIELPEGLRLGVWLISETPEQLLEMSDFLSDAEREFCKSFRSKRRQCEWLATRLLLFSMMGRHQPVEYHGSGKPYLPGHQGSISISHADGMAVVLVSDAAVKDSAVDVERITPRIERISNKFLHDGEIAALPPDDRLRHLYIHWCAKEAMYKACNIPDYDYQNSYALDAVMDGGVHAGRLMLCDGRVEARFKVLSFSIMDYVLCVASVL